MARLVREVVYLAPPQRRWLHERAEEIGISWQELLRSVVQAAKEADERRPGRRGPAPRADAAGLDLGGGEMSGE